MESMMCQFSVRPMGREEDSQAIHDDVSSPLPAADYYIDAPFDTVDISTTQLWFPAQHEAWNGLLDWQQGGDALLTGSWLYQQNCYAGPADLWVPNYAEYRTTSSIGMEHQSRSPFSPSKTSVLSKQEYPRPPRVVIPQVPNRLTHVATHTIPHQTNIISPNHSPHTASTGHESLDSDWMCFNPKTAITSHTTLDTTPSANISILSDIVPLIWTNDAHAPSPPPELNKDPPIVKRKHASPTPPPAKKTYQAMPTVALARYVGVFENAPGALTTVKKRKKLDSTVRKAAQDVRKAGACHQCRFRKRTCSTGTPCTSCIRNGRGLHELKCQRESPFTGKSIHPYFEHSSTKRYLAFDITLPPQTLPTDSTCYVTIDGIGKLSHTIKLRAYSKPINSFSTAERTAIYQTVLGNKKSKSHEHDSSVLVLEDDETLGTRLEQWAVEYASKFVHAAGSKFYPTTIAVVLGTAYVKKGLPESALIATLLRAASIAFILRAGVKYTSFTTNTTNPDTTSQYRTIQATIDTILYQRLKLAEKELHQMLQRIVFRSLGYLRREQIYPVALVFWQLLRMLSLSSSHLANISQRFKKTSCEHASLQYHTLTLVLSTHFALFRSSNPLLLDFHDKPNQDLLGGDEELIELAMKMRGVVVDFRERGVRDMRGSIAYRREHFDLFRKVYVGL